MRNTKGILKTLCIMVAIYAVISALLAIGRIRPSQLRATAEGNPIVTSKTIDDNYLGIAQTIELSDMLYVLHSEYCIVTAYTATGDYAYTISVYSHQNGKPQIATDGKFLYLKDKIDNLYIFEGDKLTDYFVRNQLPKSIDKLDFSAQSSTYAVKGNKIYHTDADGNEICIIERSFWTIFTQNNILLHLSGFAIFALAFLISRFFKKTTNR